MDSTSFRSCFSCAGVMGSSSGASLLTSPLKHKSQLLRYAQAVTTCLAAICERHQAIVIAADTKLSFGYTGTNTGGKIHGIHRDWAVLYAGSASKCMMALDWARLHIDHLPKTADAMVQVFTDACLKYPCVGEENRYF